MPIHLGTKAVLRPRLGVLLGGAMILLGLGALTVGSNPSVQAATLTPQQQAGQPII